MRPLFKSDNSVT